MTADECADGVDCSKVLADIEVYLDGELDELTDVQIAQHLGDCSPCKDRADLQECVRDLLRSRCVDQAPASLRVRLEARLQEWAVEG